MAPNLLSEVDLMWRVQKWDRQLWLLYWLTVLVWLDGVRRFYTSQLHHFQSSDARSKVLLKVVQQVQFIVLSRLGNPDAVPLLRVDL